MANFEKFPGIPRLNSKMIITEKIDGTNAQIYIPDDEDIMDMDFVDKYQLHPVHGIFAGSRNRWINPQQDNAGFAKWVRDNAEELMWLGPGRHYGEWWGSGIQRGYGLKEKRFSLFNVTRWAKRELPPCCHVVPTLYEGDRFADVFCVLQNMKETGSFAAPGFPNPEGIIVWWKKTGQLIKMYCDDT